MLQDVKNQQDAKGPGLAPETEADLENESETMIVVAAKARVAGMRVRSSLIG